MVNTVSCAPVRSVMLLVVKAAICVVVRPLTSPVIAATFAADKLLITPVLNWPNCAALNASNCAAVKPAVSAVAAAAESGNTAN